MLYLLLTAVFLAGCTVVLALGQKMAEKREQVTQRMDELVGPPTPLKVREQELSIPFYLRVVKPALNNLASLLTRYLPITKEATLAQKIQQAGNPGNLQARELMVIKYLLAGAGALLLKVFAAVLGLIFIRGLVLTFTGMLLGWLLPDFFLKGKTRRRAEEVEKSLPDTLDLLTVSVEAGLGFDGALLKVTEKTDGVLADEFIQVLQEIKMGKPRREALKEMAERLAVDELSGFCSSIIMAGQLGLPIGKVLRLQSDEMRRKRRQRAEEKAMKAPIKMLIPMVLLIFPSIFVVLLGPAVLQIIKAFAQK